MSCLSFEALGQHFHSKLKIESAACMCLQVEFCPQISSVNVGTASSVQQTVTHSYKNDNLITFRHCFIRLFREPEVEFGTGSDNRALNLLTFVLSCC